MNAENEQLYRKRKIYVYRKLIAVKRKENGGGATILVSEKEKKG